MDPRAPVNPRKLLTWLGLAAGICGLGLQLYVSSLAYVAIGRDAFGAAGHFLSFYTILTNIVLVLIYLSQLTAWTWLDLFRHPVVRGMMAANMAIVMLYVFFVLRFLVEIDGISQIADRLLHYIGPILFALWWLVTQKHGTLRFSQVPIMLAPTLVYLVYIMLRGAWVQEYPYPILDAGKLGYAAVALNSLYMALAFTVSCLVVVALDMALARPKLALPEQTP